MEGGIAYLSSRIRLNGPSDVAALANPHELLLYNTAAVSSLLLSEHIRNFLTFTLICLQTFSLFDLASPKPFSLFFCSHPIFSLEFSI